MVDWMGASGRSSEEEELIAWHGGESAEDGRC